jgi:bifunctional non-homologous end joining protein LigD
VLPHIHPIRLTRRLKPFNDPDYIFELKHDGFRAVAYIDGDDCKLVSRNSNAFPSFASLKESLCKLPVDNAIFDGEIICLDNNGVSRFNQMLSRNGKPVFYAFDLLWLDGKDLRNLPLIERKRHLCELIERSKCDRIVYAQHIETQGIAFFDEICDRDLEGIVAKRRMSLYRNNGIGWLKIKNRAYTQAEGRRELFEKG